MRMIQTILFVALIAGVAQAAPVKYTLDLATSESKVEFLAVGQPSALKIRGKTNAEKFPGALQGKLQFSDLSVSGSTKYKLEALDTGISMRDEHMKEKYLEVKKFPEASLTLTKLQLPAEFAAGKTDVQDLPFEAEQTLHGVKKPVKGKVSVKRNAENIAMTFQYQVLVNDYSIAVPSYLGIKVTDEVNVTVETKGKLTPQGNT